MAKKMSGLKSNQCPHLRSIDYCKSDAIKEDLWADVLEEMVENKWVGQEQKEKCLKLHEEATMHGTSLAAEVDFNGSNSNYFPSIFEKKVTYYS